MRIIGIDPGLQHTGWGIISVEGSKLGLIGAGVISPSKDFVISQRLLELSNALALILAEFKPQKAAIENTFVNVNSGSSLKLGNARGALLLTLAQAGLHPYEYDATLVKKTIVGVGRAEKSQVAMMVKMLLPSANDLINNKSSDALDALAIAITHHHHSLFNR